MEKVIHSEIMPKLEEYIIDCVQKNLPEQDYIGS